MEKLNKNIVKKMSMDSQEFKENDFWIVEGTPQHLWDEFWDLWVYANPQNASLLIKALAKFGAPIQDISASIILLNRRI